MNYRLPPIEVPADQPFRFDELDRKPIVDFLAALVRELEGPFVLALDSPWGTGKSTLVQMLQAVLRQQGILSVAFNAWETDYAADPLVALLASFNQLPGAKKKATTAKLRKIATAVARRSIVAGAKVATVGALDLDKELEAIAADVAGGATSDIVDAFNRQTTLLAEFKKRLEEAVPALVGGDNSQSLVIFVDEIDRCRPTFALELLERIKHLFDVPKVVFVLTLDKEQLETSLRAVYGADLDASEYLRRFVDLEFSVPTPSRRRYVASLFRRSNLEAVFAKRTHPDLQNEPSQFADYFSALSEAVGLSLRAQERCFTRLRIVMDQTLTDQFLYPALTALLIVLRAKNPGLFKSLVSGSIGPVDVFEYLEKTPQGRAFVENRTGRILAGELVAVDSDRRRQSKIIADLENTSKGGGLGPFRTGKESAFHILSIVGARNNGIYHLPGIELIAQKVDFASRITD